MTYLVFAILLLLVVVVGAIVAAVNRKGSDGRIGGFVTVGISLFLLLLITFIASINTVGARSVGVETAFGRYDGTLRNGFHLTAPWVSVEQFSTRVQYLHLVKDEAVNVTYSGGGSGQVIATVRWRITDAGAKNLWTRYRSFDNVRDNLVTQQARDSYRVVMGQYVPADAIAGRNLRTIDGKVKADLDQQLSADGIIIDSVSTQHVALDANAQQGLNQIVKANADIQRAQVEQQRAIIDAKTAEIRQKAGSLSEANLQRYCLEIVNSWDVKKNGELPATFNCNFSGGSGSVVIPAK